MPAFCYLLTLETDATLTRSNATLGYGETLEHIPGATLLGAAARSYPSDDLLAYQLFHSGMLRFGCGLPVFEEHLSVPMPLCLYKIKGQDSSHFFNKICKEPDEQPAMQKDGFLTASGKKPTIERRSSIRTSIDPDEGRAREGFLFALECIPAGSRFYGRVSADTEALLDEARKRLDGQTVFLGRSRNAELGRARIEVQPDQWLAHGQPKAKEAVFLCLSELALRDDLGSCRTDLREVPAATFGLPESWKLDAKKSVIRLRSYAPFNGYRKRPDLQRQVITAGSVLVFRGDGTPAYEEVVQTLEKGVGLYRADGLGQLWFEPPFLRSETVRAWSSIALAESPAAKMTNPVDPLLGWLSDQAAKRAKQDAMFRAVEELAQKLSRLRVPKSQWGMIRQIARQEPKGAQEKIEKLISEGARKLVWAGSPQKQLTEAIQNKDAAFIEMLAARVPHHIKKERV